jgi:hypothetical protein
MQRRRSLYTMEASNRRGVGVWNFRIQVTVSRPKRSTYG